MAAGTEWVAVILSDANGVILAVAVFVVRWLYLTFHIHVRRSDRPI